MLDIHNDLKNKMEHALGSDTYIYIFFFLLLYRNSFLCHSSQNSLAFWYYKKYNSEYDLERIDC